MHSFFSKRIEKIFNNEYSGLILKKNLLLGGLRIILPAQFDGALNTSIGEAFVGDFLLCCMLKV